MAIVIRGMPCSICGQPMKEAEPLIMFPPWVDNELDELHVFDDAAFHRECFESHPLAERCRLEFEEHKQATAVDKRICTHCGEAITDPDEYFSLAKFTADPVGPLFEFNYLHFHKSCIGTWSQTHRLISLLQDLRSTGTWKGGALDYIIKTLEQNAR